MEWHQGCNTIGIREKTLMLCLSVSLAYGSLAKMINEIGMLDEQFHWLWIWWQWLLYYERVERDGLLWLLAVYALKHGYRRSILDRGANWSCSFAKETGNKLLMRHTPRVSILHENRFSTWSLSFFVLSLVTWLTFEQPHVTRIIYMAEDEKSAVGVVNYRRVYTKKRTNP